MTEWLSQINWASLLLEWSTVLLKVVLIYILYLIVRQIGKKFIKKMFSKVHKQNQPSPERAKTLEKLTISIFSYTLLFIVIGIIFQLFGIDIKTLLAGAGIIGLAIGFGAQGLVSDIVTGFFLLLEKQIEVGDYVTVGDVDGIVEEVNLRNVHVRAFDGTLVFIPNREISIVANHSRGNMQALVDIRIPYKENINNAIQVIQKACDQVAAEEKTIKEAPQALGVQSLESAEVVIRVICKTENMEQWAVERKLRQAIKEALEQNQIKS